MASVRWCCMSVSLPGCGVGGGAAHSGPSAGPGAACVCCRLGSAAVTDTATVSRLQSSAAAVGTHLVVEVVQVPGEDAPDAVHLPR